MILPSAPPARGSAASPRRAVLSGLLGVALAGGLVVASPATAAPSTAPAVAAPAAASLPQSGALALAPPPVGEGRFDVLVFSKTAGFRHGSIEEGVAAIELLGEQNDFSVTATEDASVFTEAGLEPYEVVVWLSTTGDVLDAAQQTAFEGYIDAGGGFAGVHSASDTEYDWSFYGDLVGAYFSGHPQNQTATVLVEDPAHPSTEALPTEWSRFDEWYSFRTNPRDGVHVLASLDESTYDPGGNAMGTDHPIAWCQEVGAGRSWYTALGHTEESFIEPAFLAHLLGGIETASGAVVGDCAATSDESFEKVALDENTSNPMELDVADDGRVLYIERNGEVLLIEQTGAVRTVLDLDVTTVQEFGLVGIALDPDFTTNGWVYLYWSPTGSDVDRVSRFTLTGTSIDPASEVVVLEVPVQRSECCHAGGALEFDTQGNLYIATGDNTNPFESQGYTPTDERPGRSAFDAQRTSGNTDSLSGKVLRITPQPDGSYTVPEGNLFAPGTELTRPEIYGMGFRNPFRIGIDPLTGQLMVADYGPDAGSTNPDRGPDGRVEWQVLTEPGNYGWPYCHAGNTPYVDWNFADNTGSGLYDCDSPVNDSPNNTGLTELPPAIPAQVWYGRESTSAYPGIGTGGAPMAGPAYVYDADLDSDTKWPAYFADKALFGEWNTGQLYTVQLAEDRLSPSKVAELLPRGTITKPMAWDWGPDGALYIIDWGSGFGGNNADSGVYRIDYLATSRAPVVRATADVTSGPVPLEVAFSSEGTFDPNGGATLTYAWDLDGDGDVDSTEADPTYAYSTAGAFQALLTVTNEAERTATATVNIAAGNTRPTVGITGPPEGGFTEFGDTVSYAVEVTDPEDDAAGVDTCPGVVVKPALGHNDHGHPGEQSVGCQGEFVATIDDSHGPEADVFVIVEADYTDTGGVDGAPALTGTDILTLQPKRKQAEYFTDSGRTAGATGGGDAGVQVETTGDTAGGFQNVGFIEDGDYVAYAPVNLGGIDAVGVRAASPGDGGLVELRWDAPDGPVLATIDVSGTGGWQSYQDFRADLIDVPTGSGTLYAVFTSRTGGAGSLMNVNWFQFFGTGVSANSAPTLDSVTATPDSGEAPLAVTLAAQVSDLDGDTVTGVWTTGIAGDAPRDGLTTDVVYTEPGTYTATFRATDSRGAFRVRTVDVDVDAVPLTPCFGALSDDFDGDALDTDRWQVVRPDGNLRVEDGALVLPTTATDIYGTNNTDTPNIVVQDLQPGAFQATAKLTLPAREQYQQAGLIVYGDDDNYAKMVVQGRTAAPDASARIFQFIREEAGVPNEVGDSNTAALGADFPDTLWVRLTSTNGIDLRASWSADGVTFTDMPQTKSLTGITNPRVGMVSLVGTGQDPVIDAEFDFFTITPDDTVGVVEPSDEFEGTELDACRWQVVRPEPSALTVADGQLTLLTPNGDIYTTPNGESVTNLVLQDAPEGDWTVETKVDTTALVQQYQQGGLIAWVDDDNYVKLDHLVTSALGAADVSSSIELRSELGGVIQDPQPSSGQVARGEVWLRLARTGSTFTGEYSLDGSTWVAVGADGVPNAAVAGSDDLKVGVFTIGTNQAARVPVSFDWFRVLDDEDPEPDTTAPEVSAQVDPEQPEGGFTGPATVTVTATDDSQATGGVVYTEYRVDDADFSEYTAPVELDPAQIGHGEHTFAYRASDASGNTSEVGTITLLFVEADTTAPVVDVTLEPVGPTGAEGWWTDAVTVTVAADDGDGSGVGTIEYQVVPAARAGTWDDSAVSSYEGPVTVDDDGSWAVHARATDAAGNASDPVVVTFEIDATAPGVEVTGVTDGRTYGSAEVLHVALELTDATSGPAGTSVVLDGEPVGDEGVQLWLLAPGEHTLLGTGTDVAGNATEVEVTFSIEVTVDDVSTVVGLLEQAGTVDARTADRAEATLDRVDGFASDGKVKQAVQQLDNLERLVEREVRDATARGVLLDQSGWLTEAIEAGAGARPGRAGGR